MTEYREWSIHARYRLDRPFNILEYLMQGTLLFIVEMKIQGSRRLVLLSCGNGSNATESNAINFQWMTEPEEALWHRTGTLSRAFYG